MKKFSLLAAFTLVFGIAAGIGGIVLAYGFMQLTHGDDLFSG